MNTTVYRVENAVGDGPYREGHKTERQISLTYTMCFTHNDSEHPSPAEDGIRTGFGANKFVCAFGSRAELASWFDGYFDQLDDAGYTVVEYLVNIGDIKYGRKQCMFDRDGAKVSQRFGVREFADSDHY